MHSSLWELKIIVLKVMHSILKLISELELPSIPQKSYKFGNYNTICVLLCSHLINTKAS